MHLGIPREVHSYESRVAATPQTVKRFIKQGFKVYIEKDAGKEARYNNEDYIESGAIILDSKEELFKCCELILKVLPPKLEEVDLFHSSQLCIAHAIPTQNMGALEALKEKGCSYIAIDFIPRISRAQKMDVLSSMANIAGYRSVIEGANHFGRFLNGQITAAGKVNPANVLIIGAGVAGLAAIGTAMSLGAIVTAFDTRKDVAEQIESMGANFLTVEIEEDGSTDSGYSKVMSQAFIDAEMELFRKQAPNVDIVITTALIPGKAAPKLWLKDMVELMKPGSVVVDLAYSKGGNCELCQPGTVYQTSNGVTIVGELSQMAMQASQLYSSNLAHLLDDMGKAENFKINLEDDVIKGSLIIHEGKLNWPLPQISVAVPPKAKNLEISPIQAKSLTCNLKSHQEEKEKSKTRKINPTIISILIMTTLLGVVGYFAPASFLTHFTVFVLAIFIGQQVIWNVSHSLHTPLMSVTNAISGIILIGGILHVGDEINIVTIMALIAVLVATINIVGGFVVTHRMLKMFKR